MIGLRSDYQHVRGRKKVLTQQLLPPEILKTFEKVTPYLLILISVDSGFLYTHRWLRERNEKGKCSSSYSVRVLLNKLLLYKQFTKPGSKQQCILQFLSWLFPLADPSDNPSPSWWSKQAKILYYMLQFSLESAWLLLFAFSLSRHQHFTSAFFWGKIWKIVQILVSKRYRAELILVWCKSKEIKDYSC